jgi:hypothetical protein
MSITVNPRGGTQEPPESDLPGGRETVTAEARTGRDVLYWASFGVASTALLTYVFASWILSDDFRPTPPGPDQLTDLERVGMWVLQTLFPVMALTVTAAIVRRCVRERRFAWDAKLLIGCVLMFWLDPVPNLLQPQVLFNSHYVNYGSWVSRIPGWISPRGHNLPNGWLAWNGTIHSLSIDGGDRMQMPLTECWLVGAWLTMLSALRYFRDEDGVSVVERGLDRVRAGAGVKQVLSLFAIIGFAQLSFMAYNVFTVPLALYDDATPTGYPSYIYNQMCGPGTPYPCTGPGAPILLPRPEH